MLLPPRGKRPSRRTHSTETCAAGADRKGRTLFGIVHPLLEKRPEERTSPEDLFIHSTIFVLVDKRAQLRGVYETDGEGVDWSKVKPELLAAIEQLEREP